MARVMSARGEDTGAYDVMSRYVGAFNIVSRTGNNVLKVKKNVDATTAAHMRVINTAAEANTPLRSAAATAVTATPFLLIAAYYEERELVFSPVMERVADLHKMLISSGFLLNLAVDKIPAEVRWAGQLQDDTRLYELVEMEHEWGVILMPIFTGLLPEKEDRAREAQPGHETKSCLGCDADIHVGTGDLGGWKQVYRTFPEVWIYGLSDVPYLLMDRCDHDMEYCTRCVRAYLRV
jgi:hypothetical protein